VSAEAGESGSTAASWTQGEAAAPFCGDEYPPLKGAPGTVVCTKPCHPSTEFHENEETGWVWSAG
jgi:hypothetical protein